MDEIGICGTPDFSSPELLTAVQLFADCDDLADLDEEVRNVVAADAWSVGAMIYNAATGECLVPEEPDHLVPEEPDCSRASSTSTDDVAALRAAHLMQCHRQWQVGPPCPPKRPRPCISAPPVALYRCDAASLCE